jgi:RHS repeat-associated protein
LIILFCRLQLLTTIFLTLIFLIGGDFAVAKNQASSASLGDLWALAVNSSSSRTTTDTYDANGNTTSSLITDHGSLGTNASDIYSFDNKLIRRTTPDGKTIDLTYTPDGHRLSKFITQNGLTQRLVHYLTDANNPTGYAQVIEEKQPLDTTSPLKKVNLYGHDLISSEERGTGVSPVSSIFYSYDGLGSVRSISNATGDLQETYDYDAYGTLIGLAKRNTTTGLLESSNLSSTIPNPQSDYLYTGEQWDADLGMYFLRARYLNTNTGRFHSQDSYEGDKGSSLTLHKYLYANGNPAMFADPSGNMTLGELSAVIGQISSLTLNVGLRVGSAVKTIASVGRVIVTKIGVSVERWVVTEIGKNAVSDNIWKLISHLSAYERGRWIITNLKWYKWVDLASLFSKGETGFNVLRGGPTPGGWVGTGVLSGGIIYSIYEWGDDIVNFIKKLTKEG